MRRFPRVGISVSETEKHCVTAGDGSSLRGRLVSTAMPSVADRQKGDRGRRKRGDSPDSVRAAGPRASGERCLPGRPPSRRDAVFQPSQAERGRVRGGWCGVRAAEWHTHHARLQPSHRRGSSSPPSRPHPPGPNQQETKLVSVSEQCQTAYRRSCMHVPFPDFRRPAKGWR